MAIATFLIFLSFCCYANNGLTSQEKFIKTTLANVRIVDVEVQQERNQLGKLNKKFIAKQSLSKKETSWLEQLASKYNVKKPDFTKPLVWNLLKRKVNIIPPSLVIAQAIYESNWGRSRFAQEGNSYFGQRCYVDGCGIVPKQRAAGSKFEVKSFPSMLAAIRSYVLNLNTHANYQFLRKVRAEQHSLKRPIEGSKSADGLGKYSEQDTYISAIKGLIQKYNLAKYDVDLYKKSTSLA